MTTEDDIQRQIASMVKDGRVQYVRPRKRGKVRRLEGIPKLLAGSKAKPTVSAYEHPATPETLIKAARAQTRALHVQLVEQGLASEDQAEALSFAQICFDVRHPAHRAAPPDLEPISETRKLGYNRAYKWLVQELRHRNRFAILATLVRSGHIPRDRWARTQIAYVLNKVLDSRRDFNQWCDDNEGFDGG
jgi:hypothetical protein